MRDIGRLKPRSRDSLDSSCESSVVINLTHSIWVIAGQTVSSEHGMFVSPAFVEKKKKKRKGRTVSKTDHSTAPYRLPVGSSGDAPSLLSTTTTSFKVRRAKGTILFSKEVSLITLTDAFIGPSIFFSFFQTRQTRDLPAILPRMIGYQRCLYPVWR